MKQLMFLSMVVFLSACKPVMGKLLLGVDVNPKWQTKKQIITQFNKNKIPSSQSFIMDTISYSNHIISEYRKEMRQFGNNGELSGMDSIAINKLQKDAKDNLQPVQIRFFEKSGKPIFKMINCYVDSPIRMNWNVQNCFGTFPPQNIEELKYSHNDSLQIILRYIKTLDDSGIEMDNLPDEKYYAVVFWNSWMGKPSRKLIELLQKYDEDNKGSTHYLFVNNHNSEIWRMLDADDKELLKNN